MPAEKTKSLSEVRKGEQAIIEAFDEENMPVKMLEMGLLPGNIVTVKQIAILNGPLHIEVGGYDLALRKDEASHVIVRIIEPNTISS